MKIKEVEGLLNYLEKIYKKNPNLSEHEMYSLLVYYRASKKEIRNFFPKWVDYYHNKDNIISIVDPGWPYFCQFLTKKIRAEKALKLYVPLKPECIENGAKTIFNFLAEKNIPHQSKIGSHSRNDNIVIRVDSLNDALRIIEFVKGNRKIQEALLPTNPLIFNVSGVGLALDGNLSYNDQLSKILHEYFTWRQKIGIKSKPNALEFSKFVTAIESKVQNNDLKAICKLIRENATGEINMHKYIDAVNDYQENEELLVGALSRTREKYGDKHTTVAILSAVNNSFGYITNDYNCRDKVSRYLNGYQIKRIISRKMGYEDNDDVSKQEICDYALNIQYPYNSLGYKVKALKTGILEMIKRYGYQDDYNNILGFIKEFLSTYNYRLFTRDNNIRSTIEKSIAVNEDVVSLFRQYYQLGDDYNQEEIVRVFIEREILQESLLKR